MVVRVTVVTAVDMDDERLWDEGHLVSNWSKKMSINLTLATKAEAPVNKRKNKNDGTYRGYLRDSIDSRRSRAATRQIRINVASRAYYSEYVIFGTDGAHATTEKGLWLPGNYVGKGKNSATAKWVGQSFDGQEPVPFVAGQPPNDFLTRGIDRASRKHPSLRG